MPLNRVAAMCLAVASAVSATSDGFASDAPRSHLETAGRAAQDVSSAAALGLKLSRASGVLRQQLSLKRGAGLVVEAVVPDSRAAAAGFAQHDVLVRLDDQLLVLPEQFDALLASSEASSLLACTVLRGGRELVIAVGQPAFRSQPPARADLRLRPTDSALAMAGQNPPRVGPIAAGSLRRADQTLVRNDSDFRIRLSSGDETRLIVSDPQGRVIFDDSIDTPEGRSRMPPVVRHRVNEMERLLDGQRPGPTASVKTTPAPAAEVGRLDVPPVELR